MLRKRAHAATNARRPYPGSNIAVKKNPHSNRMSTVTRRSRIILASFPRNEVRLLLVVIAYNLGTLLRWLVLSVTV